MNSPSQVVSQLVKQYHDYSPQQQKLLRESLIVADLRFLQQYYFDTVFLQAEDKDEWTEDEYDIQEKQYIDAFIDGAGEHVTELLDKGIENYLQGGSVSAEELGPHLVTEADEKKAQLIRERLATKNWSPLLAEYIADTIKLKDFLGSEEPTSESMVARRLSPEIMISKLFPKLTREIDEYLVVKRGIQRESRISERIARPTLHLVR